MSTTEYSGLRSIAKSLLEIRVAWNMAGRFDPVGRPIQAGLWHPDTEVNRHTLGIIAEVGNEVYGQGTHWVEEREA